jgi:single-strand selective monofunctional uracil DNA glycosylase
VGALTFGAPVTHVYNPLAYARQTHEAYLRRFGSRTGRVVWMGMNPGPWGMAQTGVPFGEVAHVRDWMGLEGTVGKPAVEHPKRPVHGFDCARSEVSGRRLWGWAADRFGSADAFFERFFVLNYCPLSFMEEGGRNRIPEKLPASERAPLFEACDDALRQTLDALQPSQVIGVGGFAEACLKRVTEGLPIGRVLHPSPASPAANRGWVEAAERDLARHGIRVDG